MVYVCLKCKLLHSTILESSGCASILGVRNLIFGNTHHEHSYVVGENKKRCCAKAVTYWCTSVILTQLSREWMLPRVVTIISVFGACHAMLCSGFERRCRSLEPREVQLCPSVIEPQNKSNHYISSTPKYRSGLLSDA